QHGHFVAGLGRGRIAVPFVELNKSLALVADVDQHLVPFHADDRAIDNRIHINAATRPGDVEVPEAFVFGVIGICESTTEGLFQVFVVDVEFTKQIAINHNGGLFPATQGTCWSPAFRRSSESRSAKASTPTKSGIVTARPHLATTSQFKRGFHPWPRDTM